MKIMRHRAWLIGGIVGILVGTGGLAAAQSLLGTTTLVVNGQAYHGTFTPLESSTTLYISLPQLAQAMGFSYTWAKNQLSIETAGYTPPASSSTYPLQLHTGVSVSAATTILPEQLTTSYGPHLLKAMYSKGHYSEVSVGFTYQGANTQQADQPVTMTIAGLPTSDYRVALYNLSNGWVTFPATDGHYYLPAYDFAKPYVSRLIRIISDAPGSLTLTFTDPKNSEVPARSETVRFSY